MSTRTRHSAPPHSGLRSPFVSRLSAGLRTYWAQLNARERMWLGSAAILLAIVMTWLLGLAPALSVLRHAPSQINQLEAEQTRMTRWANSASAWREQARLRPSDARNSLNTSTRAILADKASVSADGEQAQVRLHEVNGAQLLAWLQEVRHVARLIPAETNLKADPNGLWSGTVSFLIENSLL